MNRVPMTMELLTFLSMVQTYRLFLIRKGIFETEANGSSTTDWWRETERFYCDNCGENLAKYGLVKNRLSFERVINFKITPEMDSTEASGLHKFSF